MIIQDNNITELTEEPEVIVTKNINVIEFYRGKPTKHEGLTYESAINFTDDKLEVHHSYIQWLFPLEVPSNFNPFAPLLTNEQKELFKSDNDLKNKLIVAFERMLKFYSFKFDSDRIIPVKRITPETVHWFHFGDHNYLRISRILRCLNLCGETVRASLFLEALTKLYLEFPGYISSNNMKYWQEAIID